MANQRASRWGPFRRVVILGESNAYGMCASRPQYEWNEVLARLLRRFQDQGPEVMNRAIPASVISPRCPGYEMSAKPSLMERYRQHGLAAQPDLLIIAQGLNDMRAGMPVQHYFEDLAQIVSEVRRASPALVVLVGIYPQIYGRGANDPTSMPTFAHGNPTMAYVFNEVIRMVAKANTALFVDTLALLGDGAWLLHPDCCHLDDLAHVVLGHAIFEALTVTCAGLAERTLREVGEQGISIANTGGTDTDAEIQVLWRAAAERFGVEL